MPGQELLCEARLKTINQDVCKCKQQEDAAAGDFQALQLKSTVKVVVVVRPGICHHAPST